MVNSSWTRAHINKLWGSPERIFRVYPPCHTSGLQVLPLKRPAIPPKFISLAQFRPEKAHSLKLEAFALAIKSLDSTLAKPILQFVGYYIQQSLMDVFILQVAGYRNSKGEPRTVSYKITIGSVAGLTLLFI
ncbi:hypothetical protein POM88_006060 [Heracleum sosnowskyi]|uniref:Uncharacterized protein n=1 Tax=Heracleum sosnowskyi TaxID=360622 RepID=A0AAD8N500_9APIA|nr:hypothetical protein POM88_006060 [Heracleum sosnowskyi]